MPGKQAAVCRSTSAFIAAPRITPATISTGMMSSTSFSLTGMIGWPRSAIRISGAVVVKPSFQPGNGY